MERACVNYVWIHEKMRMVIMARPSALLYIFKTTELWLI